MTSQELVFRSALRLTFHILLIILAFLVVQVNTSPKIHQDHAKLHACRLTMLMIQATNAFLCALHPQITMAITMFA
jgi:hypothetical protein